MTNHFSHDQISFYDESLKEQIEGSYKTDGRGVHVRSIKYGIKSAPYGDLGTFPDRAGLDLLAQKLLSELARDPDSGFKDLQKPKDDQQVQPRESFSCSGIRG
jgi:hypothetical protein